MEPDQPLPPDESHDSYGWPLPLAARCVNCGRWPDIAERESNREGMIARAQCRCGCSVVLMAGLPEFVQCAQHALYGWRMENPLAIEVLE